MPKILGVSPVQVFEEGLIRNFTARNAMQKLFLLQYRTFLFISTTNFQHSFSTSNASKLRFIRHPSATILRSKKLKTQSLTNLTPSTSSKLQSDKMAPSWNFRALSELSMGRVSKTHRNTCKSTTPLTV
jgi:hypothetical protein